MTTHPASGLMPIGRLARLSRLSIKMLRRYADDGLLVPAWVDPGSGYRYYRADQVTVAATIALLRSLDVPLATIGAILEAPDDEALSALLEAERARAAHELRAREMAVASISRLAGAPAAIRYDVTISARLPRRLAALTGCVGAEELGPGTGRLCELAIGRLAPAGLPLGEGLVAVFPLDLPDVMTVAVGALVDARARMPDGLEELILPGGGWATTLHVGPYDALALAYSALLDRVAELGHEPAGQVEETYLNDSAAAAPNELVTRVAVPLAGG